MAHEIVTLEDLQSFRRQLLEDLVQIIQRPRSFPKQWLKSSEVRKMLGISHGTLQNLRVNGTLPYRKLGGIMFYKYDDITKILESSSRK